jgi:hypothetical protein
MVRSGLRSTAQPHHGDGTEAGVATMIHPAILEEAAMQRDHHDLMNARRSALITSALVVSMPCG